MTRKPLPKEQHNFRTALPASPADLPTPAGEAGPAVWPAAPSAGNAGAGRTSAAAHPARTRRASSEDKGDQHFRGLLVLRIGTGEEPGHIALLHEGAVDEVPATQCHRDQPPEADGDRRAGYRQQ